MKFHNSVSKDLRTLLSKDLQRYAKEVQMTDAEYRELCEWVQIGRSPYDNGWYIASDAGIPMDYISAKRFVESGGCVITGYDAVNNEPICLIPDDDTECDTDEEVPFQKVPEDHC